MNKKLLTALALNTLAAVYGEAASGAVNTDRLSDSIIKNINTGSVTIMPNGSDTIDGQVSLAISTQYTSYTIISNGDCWYII